LPGIRRAAASEAPILILGPSGSGRSTLARAVHAASPRAAGALVEVDPGAVPMDLFESDLFGHRAGAFTGAGQDRPGRVERAEGGTLLLDQVEELPLAVQPKLLRLVAEQRYTPLGGRERAAAVRFVAIGSDDLPERVKRGAFRGDLFYRLEVLSFRLPPLKDRRRDLPALVAAILADLSQRFERPVQLSERAEGWILEHPWPGNLRQLRNFLERQLILADESALDPAPPGLIGESPPRPLIQVEEEEIRRALAYTRGHQGRAAELLGISRKALWEKRRRLGIP
jgi:DNA-binding NtrC family response regulator